MNNSESARKLNQAVNNTSKVVGGAILQAKGAFSNFWSTFTTQPVIATTITSELRSENPSSNETDSSVIQKDINIGIARNTDLKEEKDTGTNVKHGIVEIGREANVFNSNGKNDVIDI